MALIVKRKLERVPNLVPNRIGRAASARGRGGEVPTRGSKYLYSHIMKGAGFGVAGALCVCKYESNFFMNGSRTFMNTPLFMNTSRLTRFFVNERKRT